MTDAPHIPVLRAGKEYTSLDQVELTCPSNGTVMARISQANAGIVRRDLRRSGKGPDPLRRLRKKS